MLCRPEHLRLARESLSETIELRTAVFDDVWMRDLGPVILVNEDGPRAGVDFRFNGWGGKWPSEDDDALARFVIEQAGLEGRRSELVLEGGALSSDGRGTVLVTRECALDPMRNPGWTMVEVENELRRLLAVEQVVWLEQGLVEDHTDGHVDEFAAFVGPGRILVCRAEHDTSPENAQRLAVNRSLLERAKDVRGQSFEIVDVPLPSCGSRAQGDSALARSYTNFVVGNGFAVVPVFGDTKRDDAVLGLFGDLFEGRTIHPFACHPIWLGGGGPHCLSLNEPLAVESV